MSQAGDIAVPVLCCATGDAQLRPPYRELCSQNVQQQAVKCPALSPQQSTVHSVLIINQFLLDKSQWTPCNSQLSSWWIPSFHVISWLGSDLSSLRRRLYTAVDRGEAQHVIEIFPEQSVNKAEPQDEVQTPVQIQRFHSTSGWSRGVSSWMVRGFGELLCAQPHL